MSLQKNSRPLDAATGRDVAQRNLSIFAYKLSYTSCDQSGKTNDWPGMSGSAAKYVV